MIGNTLNSVVAENRQDASPLSSKSELTTLIIDPPTSETTDLLEHTRGNGAVDLADRDAVLLAVNGEVLERLEKLMRDGKLTEEDSVYGLPKVRTKFKIKGRKKKEEEEKDAKDDAAEEPEEAPE